ncbi:PhzF family phenazine biosynthesis protein [Polycladidibacter stylochi]|uniref:PhzF family phenazine biosynthesis protein n=1 Tax=Polycladidibacter stylochi TaxID=1807766 RepID=UPI00082E0859|nr:PhzF family phenazine biosynthesis protein [Pseudovibrio stylochi]
MPHKYFILDVFANKYFAGNPLAVVLDCDDLSNDQMQKITHEFNLSETVFVCTPQNPSHTASLRIFTPFEELDFAGHPTVGAAALIAKQQAQNWPTIAMLTLEEKIGLIRCAVTISKDSEITSEFDIPALPYPAHSFGSNQDIANALGLEPEDITFENHQPRSFSAGLPFVFVPVRNAAILNKIIPNITQWEQAFGACTHNNAFIYTRETLHSECHFQARMLYKGDQIREDAATGSAAAAFSAMINEFDRPLDGAHHYKVEQGIAMQRPAIISLEIDVESNQLKKVRIGGNSVVLASGELAV